MDRQAILEEKRQKLLQLKQRRAQAALETEKNQSLSSPEETQDELQPLSKAVKVNVATQTNTVTQFPVWDPATDQNSCRQKLSKQVISHSIGIQVTAIVDPAVGVQSSDIDKCSDQASSLPAENPFQLVGESKAKDRVKEQELNVFLQELIKQLHGITFSNTKQSALASSFVNGANPLSGKAAFRVSCSGDGNGRPVTMIATSQVLTGTIVVAYGPPRNMSSATDLCPGLAIVYTIGQEEVMFPEFFLHCTSPILAILIDRNSPSRIIAGLCNGRIIVWDMTRCQPSKTVHLLNLSSPMYSLTHTMPKKAHLYHSRSILLIVQMTISGNEALVLASGDGIINVWSPHILTVPRQNLILLLKPMLLAEMAAIQEPLPITNLIVHSNNELKHSFSDAFTDPVHYMNLLVVASQGGNLLRLSSDSKQNYVRSLWNTPSSTHINDLALLKVLAKMTLVVSVNLDWTILLWRHPEPPIIIPTQSVVTRIAVRPNSIGQFATLALPTNPKLMVLVVEYWDLNTRLFTSLLQVPLVRTGVNISALSFSSTGSALIMGYDDGYLEQWEIDPSMLQSARENPREVEIDIGIKAYGI